MKTIYNVSYETCVDDITTFSVKTKDNGDNLKYIISYEGHAWTPWTQGTEAARLKDHGNGVKVRVGKHKFDLDYCEMEELFLLMVYYYGETDKPTIKRCNCECVEV